MYLANSGTVVRDANQILVDLIVHLLEIEHDQIGHFKQFINNWIVTAHKAVGVEAGMNAFFVAGAEPVAHKFSLKNGFTAGCRHATAGRVHKVAIGHHLFHQIFYGDFFTSMGVPCHGYGSTGSASGSPEESDKADPRAIDGATGFKGVNTTNN